MEAYIDYIIHSTVILLTILFIYILKCISDKAAASKSTSLDIQKRCESDDTSLDPFYSSFADNIHHRIGE